MPLFSYKKTFNFYTCVPAEGKTNSQGQRVTCVEILSSDSTPLFSKPLVEVILAHDSTPIKVKDFFHGAGKPGGDLCNKPS